MLQPIVEFAARMDAGQALDCLAEDVLFVLELLAGKLGDALRGLGYELATGEDAFGDQFGGGAGSGGTEIGDEITYGEINFVSDC